MRHFTKMAISEFKAGILLTTQIQIFTYMHTLSLLHLYPHLSLSLCYNQKLQYTEEEKKKTKFNIFLKVDTN